jgi:hypothetical protein
MFLGICDTIGMEEAKGANNIQVAPKFGTPLLAVIIKFWSKCI